MTPHALRICSCMFALAIGLTILVASSNQGELQSFDEQPARSNYQEGLRVLAEAKDRFDHPKAAELLEKAVTEDNANAHARFALLYAYVLFSQFAKAQDLLPQVLAVRGELEDQDALWLDALAARIDDDRDAEIAAWKTLTDAYPEDRWAWYQRGAAYLFVEQFDAVAQTTAKALELEPDPSQWSASWIYYMYSKALFRSGNYLAAVEAAKPAEETPAVWRASYYRYALARVKSGEANKADEFAEEYRRISRREGLNSDFVTEGNLGLFFFEADDYKRAIEQFRLAMTMGESVPLYTNLGYNLVFAGELEEAPSTLEEGMAKYPKRASLQGAYGWALYKDGQLEQARDALIKARQLSKRRSFRIEKDLSTVEAALQNPNSPVPNYRPWLD